MGLGYLGLEIFGKAEILFQTIRQDDAMHFGAKTHLYLLQSLRSGVYQLNKVY
jgi:hypothetical protein